MLLFESTFAQTLSEKLLRQAPPLSINMSMDYESNLQNFDAYDSRQASSFRVSPRYRLNDTYTIVGTTGFTQAFNQENKSDMLNSSIGITRSPINIAKLIDVRPTLSVIMPTNSVQRDKDSLNGAAQLTLSSFVRTRSPLILGLGSQFRLNTHKFTVSAISGPNIQSIVTPFATLGYVLGKFQLVARGSYSAAQTYRGKNKNFFSLDESVSYILNPKTSFYVGHTNRGSTLSGDGQTSNVELFNTRSSIVYLGALYNY